MPGRLAIGRNKQMAGKFEYYESKGHYYFNLKAGNGEIIASSEGYTTERACLDGIDIVKRNAPAAPVVKVE
jgi:uncharacterized protein YegP (UPF0339 family)